MTSWFHKRKSQRITKVCWLNSLENRNIWPKCHNGPIISSPFLLSTSCSCWLFTSLFLVVFNTSCWEHCHNKLLLWIWRWNVSPVLRKPSQLISNMFSLLTRCLPSYSLITIKLKSFHQKQPATPLLMTKQCYRTLAHKTLSREERFQNGCQGMMQMDNLQWKDGVSLSWG